jgi:hypothetical protein
MEADGRCGMRALCGRISLLVPCTYTDSEARCFYPSGPCRHGAESRRAASQCAAQSGPEGCSQESATGADDPPGERGGGYRGHCGGSRRRADGDLFNLSTGEATTSYTPKPAPWFALERRNTLGTGYETSTDGTRVPVYYRRDLVRVKDVHLVGEVGGKIPVGTGKLEGHAGAYAEWRF